MQMYGFQALIRVISWLSKRDWGLAFLLAVASFFATVAIRVQPWGEHLVAWLTDGPISELGFHVGTLIFPDYNARGSSGFYLAPLCAEVAVFVVMMAFCYLVIRIMKRLRPKGEPATSRPGV
jgi:hypothetical protein